MKHLFILFLTSLLTVACETKPLVSEFARIAKGSDRGDVVEIAGSPQRRERKDYRDWWFYKFTEKGITYDYLIILEDGKVRYIGPPNVLKAPNLDSEEEKRKQENEAAVEQQAKPSEENL